MFRSARPFAAVLALSLVAALALPAHAEDAEVKPVSAKVAERIRLARNAIRFTKVAIPHSGNQLPHLQATEGRSRTRLIATRRQYARTAAESAGVVACTRGGNCGENAKVAAHYLGSANTKQPFGVYHVEGFDHAFVLIGDPKTEPAHQIVVADPWVVNAEPVLWSDHFAHPVMKKGKALKKIPIEVERGKKARETRRRVRNTMRKLINQKQFAKPAKWGDKGIWDHRSPFAGKRYKYVGPNDGKRRGPTGQSTTRVRGRVR